MAATNGHLPILRMLQQASAEVHAKTKVIVLHRFIVRRCDSRSVHIFDAFCTTYISILRVEKNDSTALMHASEHGHADVVEFLLKAGVDIDAQVKVSQKYLSIAAYPRRNRCSSLTPLRSFL